MFHSQPTAERKVSQSDQIIGSVVREMIHSAGVLVGGLLVSVILVSQEGRNMRQH